MGESVTRRWTLGKAAEALDRHARCLIGASELLRPHAMAGAVCDSHYDARRDADEARAALRATPGGEG